MQQNLTKTQQKQVEKEVKARLHKRLSKKLVKHTTHIASKFKEHASTAIIAALSFLIAIAWKDLIVKLIKENIKLSSLEKYPYLADLYTAIIVTIVAIIGITLVASWASKEDKK